MSDKSIIGYTENLGLTLYRKGAKDWDSGYIAAMQKIDQEVTKGKDSANIAVNSLILSETTVLLALEALKLSTGFQTGFILPYHKRTAPTGWLLGTEGYDIGDTGSGADYTGDEYKNLYLEYWTPATTTGNDAFTISSAKGASAEADWNAGKTITIDLSKGYIKPDKCDVRAVGQYQADAFQGHWHEQYFYSAVIDSTSGGTADQLLKANGSGNNIKNTAGDVVRNPITDGTNGTPRTGSETRPKNLSFPMIIKL